MKAKNKPQAPKSKVKVLYQYLNGRWYAFADLGDEIFFGQVPVQQKNSEKAAEQKETAKGKTRRKTSSKAA